MKPRTLPAAGLAVTMIGGSLVGATALLAPHAPPTTVFGLVALVTWLTAWRAWMVAGRRTGRRSRSQRAIPAPARAGA